MSEEKDLQQTPPQEEAPKESESPRFRGLYRYVHVSVRTLDIIIICCVIVIILVTALSLKDRGFMVTFDSRGGSDVAAIKYQYGELIDPPEEPTREGYTFSGWFIDPSCAEPWDLEEDTVKGAFTLYAGWEKKA